MRRIDESPIDPEIAAELDAIDATLADEPVDPRHAELAELALLLAGERPKIESESGRALDGRVQSRFAGSADGERGRRGRRGRLESLTGRMAVLGAVSTAVCAAVVAALVLSEPRGPAPTPEVLRTTTTASSAARAAAPGGAAAPGVASAAGASSGDQQINSAASAVAAPAPGAVRVSPHPPSNGRKVVQSANIALNVAASRIDDVAQEVFDVVGRENGIVNSSNVTAASTGYAQFELSVPSGNLTNTMTALSQLRYAHVGSRTDTTQDVNGQYVSANRQLADDRALRTSLLKQLANAATQQQIDSLKVQLRDAESAIARDQADVRSLNNRINYSHVEVTVDADTAPPAHRHSSAFTLGQAAHDAGRVLTVAAGVALITLAAMVPLALVATLALWITTAVRRRRREQALDMA